MNIAILGFGTVGSGVYELIEKQPLLTATHILVRPEKLTHWDKATDDIDEIINDPTIDCIVETLGGIHPAYEWICSCLQKKKHVVTANKAVVAKYLPEFLTLAQQQEVSFLFDASVAGGIPWLTNVQKMKQTNDINHLQGIFNGTSNYLLDHMTRFSEPFGEVLQQAQQLGYAEADPSADIDGYDIQNKLVLSNAAAFNAYTPTSEIAVFPLRGITKLDTDYAKTKNSQIKYIGQTSLQDNFYESTVFPTMIANQSLEAQTLENNNLVSLHGSAVGTLSFFGQGAGKLPTANAVLQDLLSIKQNTATPLTITHTLEPKMFLKNTYLIRMEQAISHCAFLKTEQYHQHHYHYTKPMTVSDLQKLLSELSENAFTIQINEAGEKNEKSC